MHTEKNKGRWKSGKSGNPKGRPPGTSEVGKLRAAIAEHVPSIIDQLVASAKGGDVQAARLVLERILPSMRPVEQTQALDLPADGTLTDKANAVLNAAASGLLAPGQAAQLIAALGTVAKISEIDELSARIKHLEDRRNAAR